DRDFAHGSPDDGGIVMHEVRSALYALKNRPAITNIITGLGGRDVSIDDCIRMYEIAQRSKTEDKLDNFVTWIGVRESESVWLQKRLFTTRSKVFTKSRWKNIILRAIAPVRRASR